MYGLSPIMYFIPLFSSTICFTRKSPRFCCVLDVTIADWGPIAFPKYISVPANAR